jgi:hypothetical protein
MRSSEPKLPTLQYPVFSYPTWALVRDIVRAEQRGSIAAKGIRREVRVFAVAGILDDRDPAPVARA